MAKRSDLDSSEPITYWVGDSMADETAEAYKARRMPVVSYGIPSKGLLQGDGKWLSNNSPELLANTQKLGKTARPQDNIYYQVGHNDLPMGKIIGMLQNPEKLSPEVRSRFEQARQQYGETFAKTLDDMGAGKPGHPRLVVVAPAPYVQDVTYKGKLVATREEANRQLDHLKEVYAGIAREKGVEYIDLSKIDPKTMNNADLRRDEIHWRGGDNADQGINKFMELVDQKILSTKRGELKQDAVPRPQLAVRPVVKPESPVAAASHKDYQILAPLKGLSPERFAQIQRSVRHEAKAGEKAPSETEMRAYQEYLVHALKQAHADRLVDKLDFNEAKLRDGKSGENTEKATAQFSSLVKTAQLKAEAAGKDVGGHDSIAGKKTFEVLEKPKTKRDVANAL